jgi:hypothetical protein
MEVKIVRVYYSCLWLRVCCFGRYGVYRNVGPALSCCILGRGVVQAYSRRLPTEAAHVRARLKSCGICGEQSRTATLLVPQFSPPII